MLPLPSAIGDSGYDINGVMLMVYRFGIIGVLVWIFLLVRIFQLIGYMLRNINMSPEQLAVVVGVVAFLVMALVVSMFRGFPFSASIGYLSPFIILLAWMEVIYRDTILTQRKHEKK